MFTSADLFDEDIDRFLSRVAVLGPNECWPWCAGKSSKGYGTFNLKPKSRGFNAIGSHRVAYALLRELTPGMHILHSCNSPACCNPRHLREGTNAENVAQSKAEGRRARQPGSQRGNAKLHECDIPKIRRSIFRGDSLASIGRVYGVSGETIGKIKSGTGWAHVDCAVLAKYMVKP